MKHQLGILPTALVLAAALFPTSALAQCAVPNLLTNGQVADASEVMDNFNAVAACSDAVADAAVEHTGAPQTGALAVFSGPESVTDGDLAGDVTTSGSTVTTLSPSGVTAGSYSYPTITVDAKGRITAATNGSGGSGGYVQGSVLTRSSSQTITTNTDTGIIWSSAVKDDANWWNGSNGIVVPSDGWYIITLNAEWANSGPSNIFKYSIISINSTSSAGIARSANTDERAPMQSTSSIEYLSAGDTVRGIVRHTMGSNYDLIRARLSVVKVG